MHVRELLDLRGRTALVTGGGRGIGRHLALGLAEAGADVLVASRNLAACEEVAGAIEGLGRRASARAADLARPDQVEALAEWAIAEAGRLHVLVNDAGVIWGAPTLEFPLDGWDHVFGVNVRALWQLSQRVARHMRDAGGGAILHVTSISAWRGAEESAEPAIAYGASKGAVEALTRDMAVKLAPHNIRVNAIAPGPFDTGMMDYVRGDEQRWRDFHRQVPMRRPGREDDIKGVGVFLVSDAAAFVTGTTVVVDGGTLAAGGARYAGPDAERGPVSGRPEGS
jgi:NAD(P)-dependent dehydrogenase (short-subunit alcohol dehydrogenase family)